MDQQIIMNDGTDWRGSRRTLLAGVAGLGLPKVLQPEWTMATPVPAPNGLRDFAYVCGGLILAAHDQADLEPLADVRYQTALLLLTAEAAVAAPIYTEDVGDRIFAAGATQLYAYVAANEDQTRALVINLVEATTPDGAETIVQTLRQQWPQLAARPSSPDEAPDADSSFVGTLHGRQKGVEDAVAQDWVFGGVRFGNLVAIWQVGFQTGTPDPALAAPINRVLRDYLSDQHVSSRRGASLAFLATIPEQPHIGIAQFALDSTVLGYWHWDADKLAEHQAEAERVGLVNGFGGSYRGPGRLAPNMFIDEFATAERARQYFASYRHDQPANDQALGVTRRALGADEFSLTGWDEWDASAVRVQREDYGSLGMAFIGLLGAFVVYVEVLDDVSPDAADTPPDRGGAALHEWSAIAKELLAPMPAAARHVSSAEARAVFPPLLPAFADPLDLQG